MLFPNTAIKRWIRSVAIICLLAFGVVNVCQANYFPSDSVGCNDLGYNGYGYSNVREFKITPNYDSSPTGQGWNQSGYCFAHWPQEWEDYWDYYYDQDGGAPRFWWRYIWFYAEGDVDAAHCPLEGNPVVASSGIKFQRELDIPAFGPAGLMFERYYASDGAYNTDKNFGIGWRHTYSRRLDESPSVPQYTDTLQQSQLYGTASQACTTGWADIKANTFRGLLNTTGVTVRHLNNTCEILKNNAVVARLDIRRRLEIRPETEDAMQASGHHIIRPDGSAYHFEYVSNQWVNTTGQPVRLQTHTQDSISGWLFTDVDDTQEFYNNDGQLLTITDRAGRRQTLTYQSGRLASVADAFGHSLEFTYDTNGRLTTVSTAAGDYVYGYDSGNLVSVTYPDTAVRQYEYEDANFPHALTGIIDENNNAYANWTYDTQGRVMLSEHAGGADEVQLQYNTNGTTTVTDALGATRTHTFAIAKNGIKPGSLTGGACTGCNSAQQTTYDSNGFVDLKTDWNGNVTDYDYNAQGLETQRIEAKNTSQQRTITTTWHSTLRLPTLITEPGRTTAFTYDSNGNTLTETITDTATSIARTTTWTYNSHGQVLTINGPRTDVTDVTTYTYDTEGNVASITDALSHVTQFTAYDDFGNPLTIVDPNGNTTTLTYDARQRLLTRTVADGTADEATTTFEYWPTGKLKKITQPDASYLLYTYDNAQRLIQIEDNLGNYIAYTLDDAGNRTEEEVYDTTDVLVKTQTAVFNNLSRLIETVGASSQSTDYAYDNNGNQTGITDPNNYTTTNTFDALNRLIKTVDPQNGSTNPTEYTYDSRDNLTSVEDPRGLVTQYQYNGFNEVTQQTSPDTGVTTYTYDAAGNRISQTDAKSVTINYSYDALNRLTLVNAPGTADDISYSYDSCAEGVGKLCSVTRDNVILNYAYDVYGSIAHVEQEIGTVSVDLDYVYNEDLHLESIIYPSGVEIEYAYDSAGRLSSITLDEGLTSTILIDNISYQPFGAIKGYDQDNGVNVIFDYDLDGRIENITAGTVLDRDYSYDFASNISLIDDSIINAMDRTYTYDAINRLSLEEDLTGTTTLFDYAYDPVGNRTLYDDTVTSQSLTYGTTNNRLTAIESQSITSDSNGNITSIHGMTLAYDAHNRLSSSTVSSTTTNYVYNGLGERVSKQNSSTTHYFYGAEQQLLTEYDSSGNVKYEYIYLYGQPVVMLDHSGSGVDIYWIHNDHIGRPLALTNEAGAVVWKLMNANAFGNATNINEDPDNNSTNLTFNLRFPGQYFDTETGLYYNYFRDYDPRTGRYIESDPIGLDGGLNTYAYVLDNPLTYIDPLGLQLIPGALVGQTISTGPVAGNTPDPNSIDTTLPLPEPTKDNMIFCFLTGLCEGVGPISIIDIADVMNKAAEDCPPASDADKNRRKSRDQGISDRDIGPSGKPKQHNTKHKSRKSAEQAARHRGKGAPIHHPSPQNGRPHYHPTDAKGNKIPGEHHSY